MKVFPLKTGSPGGIRRRGVLAIVAAVAALAVSGAALAWHGGFGSASLVSATFFANTVSNSQSQTCTAAKNDSIQVTFATYTGTATSSDANLNGPITLDVKSVYDATTNAGSLSGIARIGTQGSSSGFFGGFVAVNAAGHVQGFLTGQEGGGGGLLANFSASFTAAGGFSSSGSPATIGSGTATNTAVVGTSNCSQTSNKHGDGENGNFGNGFKFGNGLNFGNGFKFGHGDD
jgi:hypothetical protein